MKYVLRFCLLMLIASTASLAAPIPIKSPITAVEKQKVDAFLGGRSALDVDSYRSPHLSSIAPVEHVLFRKAVLLGGIDVVFEDLIVPNSARARACVHNGSALSAGNAHWHSYYKELSDHVFESDVVIAQGVYEKGIYVARGKQQQLRIKSRDDLAKLGAVSDKNWETDWATLSDLKPAKLYSAPTRVSQFKMVEAGRADFTLQDFSNLPDLSIEEQGVRLYPVPGVKIALIGTRHFFINKDLPHSRAVFEALQKGLKILKQRGEIDRALQESGITNQTVSGWLRLNP